MRSMFLLGISALAAAVALGACANQKAPAEAAVGVAQTAFAAVSADAMKYVPDQAKSIEGALASAQESITKGDYAAALTAAQALPAQVASLATAVTGKKAEFSKLWTDLGAGVPAMVTALTSRMDVLGKSKKLPAGITKETFASAQPGLATANQSWSAAMAAAQSGDVMGAVKQASEVKTTVTNLMKSLNMQLPAGL